MAQYKLIHADSIKFLSKLANESIPIIVTGLPDMEELSITDPNKYISWFGNAANLIFQKTNPDGYAIFIQTDRKKNGQWIDKSYYLTKSAKSQNFNLIWHKICLTRPVNSTDLHRPTYNHVLCYSRSGRPGASLPDVVESKTGDKLYKNGTSLSALKLVMTFLTGVTKRLPNADIWDPFVGQGSVPYMANKYGFNSIGIDIDENQLEKAEELLESINKTQYQTKNI